MLIARQLARKTACTLILIAMVTNLCWGWGREGHEIIAAIAEDHLDETTKVMILSLIGNNHLYSIATWADEIRRDRPDTKTWHHVNIPMNSTYNAARDCPPPGCVVGKIAELLSVLNNTKLPREQRAEALKFLVHFAGDIHQPMHAVKEAAGGNGINVSFMGSDCCGKYGCSLHGVWDSSLIIRTGLNRPQYTNHLEEIIKGEKLESVTFGSPVQWANDSRRLAEEAWVHDGAELGEPYYRQQIAVVDRQMALAGLRLAKLLNDSIGKKTPRDFANSQPPTVTSGGTTPSVDAHDGDSGVRVWVNSRSMAYHCPGSQWYGKTKNGEYMPEAEAQKMGYHPANRSGCR